MDTKSRLIALLGSLAVLICLGLTSANATVETNWPQGTPNTCKNPTDAFFNFETGIEEAQIESSIPGVQFTTTLGINWSYADIRTGTYNVDPYRSKAYETNGNFFAWLGVEGDKGRITFTGGKGTYLSVLVSTASGVTLDAYDIDGNFLATSGSAEDNTNTGTLTRLTVEAPNIAYVEIHDTGNYWIMDDLCTDAPPPCRPVPGRTNGDANDRINLVFVPGKDYNGNMTTFLSHVNGKIDNYLAAKPPVNTNLDKFNFYYTELEGEITGSYPTSNCGELSSLPSDFISLCPEGRAYVVLHATNDLTDCSGSSGDKAIFSAEGAQARSFPHESGHGLFQLRDEYRGSTCDYTPYNTNRALPSNIWATEEDCRSDCEDRGWDPDECYMFTSCQGDWWKLGDPNLTSNDDKYNDENFQFIMKDGEDFSKGWGKASEFRISYVFDNLSTTPEPPLPPPSGEKCIILKLNISESGVVLLDKGFVLGPAPKYWPGEYNFSAKMFHSSGSLQGKYGFPDPRIKIGEDGGGPGSYMRASADFTLVLPYFNHLGFAQVVDNSTGATLLSVDLTAFATAINTPPVSGPNGPYLSECEGTTTNISVNGTGSIDPDGDPLTYSWMTDCPGGSFSDPTVAQTTLTVDTWAACNLNCSVSLTVTDPGGLSSVGNATVTVRDTTPPVILCKSPSIIKPLDAPISFTAEATDNCSAPSVEIKSFNCTSKKGGSKAESCVVNVAGNTITILDSGGVGDNISWMVHATDGCGNSSDQLCSVSVINPGLGK